MVNYRGKTAKEAKQREEWYWAHRDEILAKQKQKRSTPEYKQKQKDYYQKRKKELNEQQKERRIRHRAEVFAEWHGDRPPKIGSLRSIKLDRREKNCLICNFVEPVDKNGNVLTALVLHHLDYNIPELVATLCYSCHRKVHNGKIKLSFTSKTCPLCGHIVYKVFKQPDTCPPC